MLGPELLRKTLQAVLRKGGQYADIYVEEKKVSNIWCEDNRLEKIHTGREAGAGIRVIKDGRTAYVYTNDLSENGLLQAAQTASEAIKTTSTAALGPISIQSPVGARVKQCRWPRDVSWSQKADIIMGANEAARCLGKDVRQVVVSMGDIEKRVLIANHLGEVNENNFSRVRASVQVTAYRDGIMQTGYETCGGVCGWEILERSPLVDIAIRAGSLAIKMLAATPAPAGRMPVIMAAQAGGTMVHEACGHGLEADLVQKGLSVYGDKMGQKVASPLVTVIDDATLDSHYGSYWCDDEGYMGQRTVLIDQGCLVGYMYDLLTAQKAGTSSTGNGRRESYQYKPIPRMSNTIIAPGQDDPEEILGSTQHGLLVIKMGGGQVNTINGDFVFDVQEGYLVENGRVCHPVRGATLTGNGPQALRDVDRVGHDLGFSIGVCGKDGQGVPVSDGQPTIRIKELTVGGIAGI